MKRASSAEQPVPGDALLHPVAIAAIAVLVLNDHFLKSAAPGLITGKLSDFAGLTFFPLFLLGAWEVAVSVVGRWGGPTRRSLILAVLATGSVFAVVKATALGSEALSVGLGWGQWLAAWPLATVAGLELTHPAPVLVVQDTTDLVALLALTIALAIGVPRCARASTPDPRGSFATVT